jgi:hypothetical protein
VTVGNGDASSGSILQTGGTANIRNLGLGSGIGATGTYTLSGPYNHAAGTHNANEFAINGGTYNLSGIADFSVNQLELNSGQFNQSAGDLTAQALAINNTSVYNLTGGNLNIDQNWSMSDGGTLDFGNGTSTVTVAANSSVNISEGNFLNASNATLNILGVDSFIILPAGFIPANEFGTYNNEGTAYTIGSTLEVLFGRTVHPLVTS